MSRDNTVSAWELVSFFGGLALAGTAAVFGAAVVLGLACRVFRWVAGV